MRRILGRVMLLTAMAGLVATVAWTQDRSELLTRYLRTDLAAKKTAIMSSALLLPANVEKAFWPVYERYQRELTQLTGDRGTIIKEYLRNYTALDDAEAKELMERVFELQERRLGLLRKYATEMQQAAVPVKQVAKFVQVEAQILRLVDLQTQMELPPLR